LDDEDDDEDDVQSIKAPVPDNATKEQIELAIAQADKELMDILPTDMTTIINNINGPAGAYCTTMNNVVDMIRAINDNPTTKGEKAIFFSHYVSALDLTRATIKKRLPNVKVFYRIITPQY